MFPRVLVLAVCRACGESVSGPVQAQTCAGCGGVHPAPGDWLETWMRSHRDPVGTMYE